MIELTKRQIRLRTKDLQVKRLSSSMRLHLDMLKPNSADIHERDTLRSAHILHGDEKGTMQEYRESNNEYYELFIESLQKASTKFHYPITK